eukprot:758991-Pyramimonas_sp.AAC.1
MAQDGSKRASENPRWPPRWLNIAQDASRWPPQMLQEAPRPSQDCSKWPRSLRPPRSQNEPGEEPIGGTPYRATNLARGVPKWVAWGHKPCEGCAEMDGVD